MDTSEKGNKENLAGQSKDQTTECDRGRPKASFLFTVLHWFQVKVAPVWCVFLDSKQHLHEGAWEYYYATRQAAYKKKNIRQHSDLFLIMPQLKTVFFFYRLLFSWHPCTNYKMIIGTFSLRRWDHVGTRASHTHNRLISPGNIIMRHLSRLSAVASQWASPFLFLSFFFAGKDKQRRNSYHPNKTQSV